MSFEQRTINLQFTTDNNNPVDLTGLRVAAIVKNAGTYQPMGMLELRVWGMSLDHMNQYCSNGTNFIAAQNKKVSVLAGSGNNKPTLLFSGDIVTSHIEFNPPDVVFCCSAVAGYYYKALANPMNSYQGAHNAEDIIAALAEQTGLGFKNNGAHGVLCDQYLTGSLVDQIVAVANNARFPIIIENDKIEIWPNGGARDNSPIVLNANNGLIGYPSYWAAGFIVQSIFNQNIGIGKMIRLESAVPKSQGDWLVFEATHEITTMMPEGSWKTTAKLGNSGNVPIN